MTKLQKQLSRKVGDKEYSKYVIVIPSSEIEKSGLKEGQELKLETRNNKIIINGIN
ncbi:MAG: AbrB/MazE/SpoVT family DNA-binding domain-containing protein [Nanoarchaeota archaeon]